jgi:hypothetical protein
MRFTKDAEDTQAVAHARDAYAAGRWTYIYREREKSGQISGKLTVYGTDVAAEKIDAIESVGWRLVDMSHCYEQSGMVVGTYLFRRRQP